MNIAAATFVLPQPEALRETARRFRGLNRERLRRLLASLPPRQRAFFEGLPLLFHVNDARLPGFVSEATPTGIADYSPEKTSVEAVREFARDFGYRRRALRTYPIRGLYLMGSSGTIAHSDKSDYDLWLCHAPGLPERGRAELRRKAEGVQAFAGTLGLELHVFLVDADEFRAGQHEPLSLDSVGSTQHGLLLDEFYRTALLLAGQGPLWWLVPPEAEREYDAVAAALLNAGLVSATDHIDLGGLAAVRAWEFFGAALWQIYKGIDRPYKSVLKIQLLESYTEDPFNLLSLRFKHAVYAGETRLDRVDPYVMMCERVQEYLIGRGEPKRLEIARRAFYFKVGIRLSQPARPREDDWRRALIQEIAQGWGWDQAHLTLLDTRPGWKIHRVLEERNALVDELTQSYQMLSRYARHHTDAHGIDPAELNTLGRKLYSAFERKAGKIELVNPGIASNLVEDAISLHENSTPGGQASWVVYRGEVDPDQARLHTPLRRSVGVLELIAWCYFNGLLARGTRLMLYPGRGALTRREVWAILDNLERSFPERVPPAAALSSFEKPARAVACQIYLNLGVDPMEHGARPGLHVISDRTDAFAYGALWRNLALTTDQFLVTSWQELLTRRYNGLTGLLDCLCEYLQWSPVESGAAPPMVEVYSYTSSRPVFIAQRVENLFEDVLRCFYGGADGLAARYVLQAESGYFMLEHRDGALRYQRADSLAALLELLALPHPRYRPVLIDRHTDDGSPLRAIYEQCRPGKIELFYERREEGLDVYIVDERGSLLVQSMEPYDEATTLAHFQRFLETVLWRSGMRNPAHGEEIAIERIAYFQLTRDRLRRFRAEPRDVGRLAAPRAYFGVQVLADAADEALVTIYCDHREFSALEFGDRLFTEVARHVLSRRASGETYPIYITDVDVPRSALGTGGTEPQTLHYLRYKRRLEDQLNEALRAL